MTSSDINKSWPIDRTVLAQTAGPNAAKLLPQLIQLYIEDGDILLTHLTEALPMGHVGRCQQAAHKLKGNSASLGVMTIAELANEVEEASRRGDLTAAAPQLALLAAEYDRVKFALAIILQERG